MKKKIKSSLLAGALTLLLISPVKSNELKDISKPYLGAYDCTKAYVGSKDVLSEFSVLRLELKDEENYCLYYQEKNGKRSCVEGKYAYDKERGVLTFQEKGGIAREFPFEKGKLTVAFPVGNHNVILQFERP